MDLKILTRKEAADALRIGTTALDALIRRSCDPLPSLKIGHRVFIPCDALAAWIDRQTMKTTAGEEE